MKFFLTFFAILTPLFAAAQYPQIVPVTPEAAALTKIVNYPVDLNTGVPNINIPLHEIKTGGLVLPIGISYHAGGFKINEQATRLGLGWSLDCELQITRTVNGLDDLSLNGYYNNSKVKAYHTSNPGSGGYPFKNTSSDFYSRDEHALATGLVDGQPDQFSYKLLNKAGSFYFQKDDNGNVATIVPVPYDNIKIEFVGGRFIITDTDGTVYYFGEPGTSTPTSRGIEYTEGSQYIGNSILTTWKCKKIENATKTAEIGFEYVLKPVAIFKKATDFIEFYQSMQIDFSTMGGPDCATVTKRGDEVPASQYNDYDQLLGAVPFHFLASPKYMENYGGGLRTFHMPYINLQNDQLVDKTYSVSSGGFGFVQQSVIAGVALARITFNGGSVEFPGSDKLNQIIVRDKFNNQVKNVVFNQSLTAPVFTQAAQVYNGNSYYGTYYLDDIQINGSDIYRFMYKQKVTFGNHLIGQDAWGYRNNLTTEISSYPAAYASNVPRQSDLVQKHMVRFPFGCTEIPVEREFSVGGNPAAEIPDGEYMAFGTLQRIVYPTGGYTDFDLEPNKYNERINIFNDDQPNLDAIPRTGGGLRVRSISYYDGVHEGVPAWRKIYKYGELQNGMGIALNKPAAIYNELTRKLDAFSYEQYIGYIVNEQPCSSPYGCLRLSATESKRTLAPASYLNYTYSNGSPIYYTKVTEYQHDLGVATGKKEYAYYRPGAFNLIDGIPPLELMHITSVVEGTNIPWQHSSGLMGMLKSQSDYKFENCELKLVHQKNYTYKPYIRPQQVRVVYSFLKTIYQLVAGPAPTVAGGVYNDQATFFGVSTPPEIYKSDEYGIAVGKLLLEQEEEKWFEGSTNMTTSTYYYYDNSQYLQPSRILMSNSKGEQIQKQLKYTYDLSGETVLNAMLGKNIISPVIEETTTNIAKSKELYKIRNNYANFSAGPGFIAASSVQKSYNGGALENEFTFDQYDQWANPIQLTAKDQIVRSFVWAYDGQYPVSEVTGMSYSSVNAIVNPGGATPDISASYDENDINSRITNLRNATNSNKTFITTFTHKPLIGVTSKTDERGRKEFYEYDAFGRLKIVRNNETHIVKQLEYYTVGNVSTWHQNGAFYTLPGNAAPVLPAACSTALQRTDAVLETYVPPINIPSPNTNIEFYKDGFLNETGSFPVVSYNNIYTNQINIPIGNYEVRFVPSEFYTGPEVKYFYTTPANPGTFIRIYSGSVLNIQQPASGSYRFYADNTGTITE